MSAIRAITVNIRSLSVPARVALVAIGVVVGARIWLFASGRPADLGWTQAQRRVQVVDPNGPAAGRIQPGDRVVAFDGHSVEGPGIIFYRLNVPSGRSYAVTVERGTERLEYQLIAGRAALYLAFLFVGLVWCAVAGFIAVAGTNSSVTRLAIAAMTLTGAFFLIDVGGSPLPSAGLIFPLHAVVGFHFAYRFPDGLPARRVWTWTLILMYSAAALLLTINLTVNAVALVRGAAFAMDWAVEHRLYAIRNNVNPVVLSRRSPAS